MRLRQLYKKVIGDDVACTKMQLLSHLRKIDFRKTLALNTKGTRHQLEYGYRLLKRLVWTISVVSCAFYQSFG
jgi:hypothetical protein